MFGSLFFKKKRISATKKNGLPEAAPPTDGELIFNKRSFSQKTTRRRQRRQRMESLFSKNCNFPKKRPAGGSAANEGRAYYPATYYRLPRDLLSITPRPKIYFSFILCLLNCYPLLCFLPLLIIKLSGGIRLATNILPWPRDIFYYIKMFVARTGQNICFIYLLIYFTLPY